MIDNVSGQILHELKHRSVDTSKGVHTHVVENVVYYSYWTSGEGQTESRGGRITVAELYESREKNERFNE
jgi:ER membrane protein complex subunit 1, C-terminal